MVSQIDPTRPADGVPAVKSRTGGISVVTRGADAVDRCPFLTSEAGARWYGFPDGKDFS